MAVSEVSFLTQLSANSAAYRDPLAHLDWAALSLDEPWLPSAAISLAGVAEFEAQSALVKRRLSQYEFLHFIEAGLWLERIFIARLGAALRHTETHAEYVYHLHEIREEAGHGLMFLKLMERSGLHLPAAPAPRLADWLGRHAPVDSLLFWLAATLGEEVPDKLNRYIRTHGEGTNELIRQMCSLHLMDEARHIARARTEFENRAAGLNPMMRKILTPVASLLVKQFTRRFYAPHPMVYELAGLMPGIDWQRRARANPARIAFMQQALRPSLHGLAKCGMVVGMPRL